MHKKLLIILILAMILVCNDLVYATKGVYLILFEKEKKIELVQELVNTRKNQIKIKIESLQDLKIPNNALEIKKYLSAIPTLHYLLFMGNLDCLKQNINLPGYSRDIETDFLIKDVPIG